ncbi:MAG TPA: hypothetical protein ENI73_08605 [Spirochaetes bacterium]|nr:hypothetical protein [Spirochaetota bacterium]
MDKTDILNFLAQHKIELKNKYHVSKVGLFGSYAKGTQKRNSDIDIIINGEKINDEELKLYLEKGLNRKVDIVKESNLYHFMKYIIDKEAMYV